MKSAKCTTFILNVSVLWARNNSTLLWKTGQLRKWGRPVFRAGGFSWKIWNCHSVILCRVHNIGNFHSSNSETHHMLEKQTMWCWSNFGVCGQRKEASEHQQDSIVERIKIVKGRAMSVAQLGKLAFEMGSFGGAAETAENG